MGLKLEFQVFGGIDMLNDVTQVWLAGTHSAQALQRVQAFYQGKRVLIQVLGAAPPGTLEGGGGNLNQGLAQQLRPLVAYGGGLNATATKDLQDTRTAQIAGPTASTYRDLLASCIVMSVGLEQHARALIGHLEPGDGEALKRARDDLNKRWTTVQPHLAQVDRGLVARLTGQVRRANAAVDAALQSGQVGGQGGQQGDPQGGQQVPAPRQNGGQQGQNPPPVPPRPNKDAGMRQRRATPALQGQT
jgi:hypothetical protein